jgi:hypothetical protein
MEATGYSKILIPIYKITRHHIPEDRNLNTARRENPKSRILYY